MARALLYMAGTDACCITKTLRRRARVFFYSSLLTRLNAAKRPPTVLFSHVVILSLPSTSYANAAAKTCVVVIAA